MKVVCVPFEQIPVLPDQETVYFALYHTVPRGLANIGHIAPSFLLDIRRKCIRPSIEALDFATLSFSIAAADETISRRNSVDGWTRMIELTVALINPEPWEPLIDSIQNTLRFLSGDYWTIKVINGGVAPQFCKKVKPINADCVCLLSGGTDSLIGAIDLVSQGHSPVYVSRKVRGDCNAQRLFATELGPEENHCHWSCTIQKPAHMSEESTRARSLVFFAYATVIASAFENTDSVVPIIVPENGFISLNLPLNPSRIGSLSTKTTHPIYMTGIQHILDSININAELQLPYRFKTKGEMILECQDQKTLHKLIDFSISCGKYRRNKLQHCGVCVPCLVRRAAYLHAKWVDNTEKGYKITPSQTTIPDDTMAVSCAILRYRNEGIERFTSGLLSFASEEEKPKYKAMIDRGLQELSSLLEGYGII